MFGWYRPKSVSPSRKNYDKDQDNYKNYKVGYSIDKDASDRKRILDSVETKQLYTREESKAIEDKIDDIVKEAREGKFKKYTVDKAPLRYM